jgi:N-methylhydantoinase A
VSDKLNQNHWRIAGDIGGTFTDLILVDPSGECRAVAKVLTTPDEPAEALESGIIELLAQAGDEVHVHTIVHGTTLVANALIERRGAATALVTTEGFRDVLEVGRELRYDLYDLDIVLPDPLVPRRWRFEVRERVLADGTVVTPLDEEEIRGVADRLKAENIESVAIAFIHAYQWPDHERRAAEILRDALPDVDVTTSAEVLPQLGEYARTSTAAANAYTRPLVRSYISDIESRIRARIPAAALSLVVSTGRVAPAATAAEVPIRLVESGPAGGVLAAAATARSVDVRNALAFDMGGTTAKAGYITNGEPRQTDTFEVSRVNRFVKGSGLPIQVPSIELVEIGAGGGSIAWMDRLGLLRIGPRSSGSVPGPACYGKGGTAPTVTDADLILGYIDAGSFLGGTMSLDVDAAMAALSTLAISLDLDDPIAAAQAVRRVVDEQMAAAARMHAIEQGLDPTQYTLVATGGAGPVHAFSVARILRVSRILSPARAGVASAHGFLGAPFGFDVARSAPVMLSNLDWLSVLDVLDELETEARAKVGHIDGSRSIEADLRYTGQGATVTISVPGDLGSASAVVTLKRALEAEYRRRYGRVPEGVEPEILTWRLSYAAPPPQVLPAPSDGTQPKRSRHVWFEELGGYVSTPVVGRPDAGGEGPLIVEERESTLVVPPGARVELLDHSVVAVVL